MNPAEVAFFIARRLLARLPPAVTSEASRAALAADFAALPDAARRHFLNPRGTVTVASAVPLEAPAQQACQAMLAGAGTVVFVTDPALIAGIELRVRHMTLRANWRGELRHIAAALDKGKEGQGAALDPPGALPPAPTKGQSPLEPDT
jgi:F-type H+-transporting ATPase subunit b